MQELQILGRVLDCPNPDLFSGVHQGGAARASDPPLLLLTFDLAHVNVANLLTAALAFAKFPVGLIHFLVIDSKKGPTAEFSHDSY